MNLKGTIKEVLVACNIDGRERVIIISGNDTALLDCCGTVQLQAIPGVKAFCMLSGRGLVCFF